MKRTIVALVLTAAGFTWLWQYEATPHSTTTTTTTAAPGVSGVPQVEPGIPDSDPRTGTRTVAGPPVQAGRHGTVQVQVVFEGTAISEVQVLQAPDTSPTERALPTLRQEALTAQSAEIDTVSGATMTSEAYATSLQAAIDGRG